MNHPEDEKAARKYALSKMPLGDDHFEGVFFGGTEEYPSDIRDALAIIFLAGANHVRTSVEWRGMEKVVDAARGCGGLHRMLSSLDELDRIRGDK